jgi:hypothetical protein
MKTAHFFPTKRARAPSPKLVKRPCIINFKSLFHIYNWLISTITQVQWNLFTVHTLNQGADQDLNLPKHSMWFQIPEIEDNFRKYLTPQEVTDG